MMKSLLKILTTTLLLTGATISAFSQVKIGDNPGNLTNGAALEIESQNKGVLLPRVILNLTTLPNPLPAHVAGMVVYNTASANDVTPGFYYNDGTKWVRIATGVGNTILSGTTAPSNSLGNPGDFFINTANNTLFGPKGATTWPTGVSLVGPAGPAGAQGIQGIQGPAGPAGSNATVTGTAPISVASGVVSLNDLGVTTAKLANDAVTTAKIDNNTIIAEDLANGAVTNPKIADNAVNSAKIDNNTIIAEDLANGAVTNPKIADNAVNSAKIDNNTIIAEDLANDAVTNPKIADNAVNSAKIANNTIIAEDLANLAVTGPKIDSAAVTTIKIANRAVDSTKIATMNATTGQVLTYVFGRGWVPRSIPSSNTSNIYTSDGTLQTNRLVTMNDKNLTFEGSGSSDINLNPGRRVLVFPNTYVPFPLEVENFAPVGNASYFRISGTTGTKTSYTPATDSTVLTGLRFGTRVASNASGPTSIAGIDVLSSGTMSAQNHGSIMIFRTVDSGLMNTNRFRDRLRLDSKGNVGVNTAGAASMLDPNQQENLLTAGLHTRFQVNGAVAFSIHNFDVSSAGRALGNFHHTALCNTTSGSFTMNLPNPTTCGGRIYVIQKTDPSPNVLTLLVSGGGSILVPGGGTITSLNYPTNLQIQSNGTNWIKIN